MSKMKIRGWQPILFWYTTDEHGYCSNFADYRVHYGSYLYLSSEHAYQSAKSLDPEVQKSIREAETPKLAASLGRSCSRRPDWELPDSNTDDVIELVKDRIMFEIVLAKFQQNNDIRIRLLDTGDAPLIEASFKDDYWGWGPHRDGRNKLGKILERVRGLIT